MLRWEWKLRQFLFAYVIFVCDVRTRGITAELWLQTMKVLLSSLLCNRWPVPGETTFNFKRITGAVVKSQTSSH